MLRFEKIKQRISIRAFTPGCHDAKNFPCERKDVFGTCSKGQRMCLALKINSKYRPELFHTWLQRLQGTFLVNGSGFRDLFGRAARVSRYSNSTVMIVHEVATTARNVPSERKEMFGTHMARMCASLLRFNSEDRPELGCDARNDPSERKEVFGTRKGRMCLLLRFRMI